MKVIALENIRSVFNVGSIFRIADATNVDHIILIGYTPTPINRFGLKNNKLSKTALGAEETIKWTHVKTTEEALKMFPNCEIVAVEQSAKTKQYTTLEKQKDILFIFGNEVTGIEKETLEKIQTHIEIPMDNKKESLNVAISAAVILYHYNTLTS